MIELLEVSKRYGEREVVRDVSLRVAPGEIVVLLGGSGSGKTTTLRMMNRLVEPSAGGIRFRDRDVRAVPPSELRRQIGYVFQGIGLFPHLTVAENVGITAKLLGYAPDRLREKVDGLLDLIGLDPAVVRHLRPDALSGGQAQRVAVARALCADPPLILLDEPFGALDPITRERLQRSFRELRDRFQFSAVFVTHDVVEALTLGDRVGVMRDGRLLQLGRGEELLASPADDYVAELVRGPLIRAREVGAMLDGGTGSARPAAGVGS